MSGQPDELDDVIYMPGGPVFAGNVFSQAENGRTTSAFGLDHVEGKVVHFDTEKGRRSVEYRDVTMAPGEREAVIFVISSNTSLYDRDPENHIVRMVMLDSGIRVDIHHFDIPVYVEGLGRVGTCPLTVYVKENAYYEP